MFQVLLSSSKKTAQCIWLIKKSEESGEEDKEARSYPLTWMLSLYSERWGANEEF